MKKKVIFINPSLTMMDRYGIKIQSGGKTPPLGLAYLAGMTRNAGYETYIIDSSALGWNCEKTAKEVLSIKANYVGLTAVTSSVHVAAEIARLIKEGNKNIVTIIGGHHLTALPEKTIEMYPEFDFGIIGEGELTILDLLNVLDKKRNLENVKGIIFRYENHIILTTARQRIKNLDELPYPALDLLPNLAKNYCPPIHTIKQYPAGMLVTSRGCPGRCIFCSNIMFKRTLTAHSAEYVNRIVKDLYFNYGIREIQFRDDNFTVFSKRLFKICELFKQNKFNLTWSVQARADHVDDSKLKVMRESGCWQIWYGIESGSQEILDNLKKDITLEQIEKAVRDSKKNGLNVGGEFIIGNPGETTESLKKTLDFMLKLNIDNFHATFMTPFPGSELYETSGKDGLFDNDWKKLTAWYPIFIPNTITKSDIIKWSKKFYRRFYLRPKIILSFIKRIKSFNHILLFVKGFFAIIEWQKKEF